jgi:hypothetical protein
MKKKEKHPKDMTTEEAVKHLFHPKVVKHLKETAQKEKKSK